MNNMLPSDTTPCVSGQRPDIFLALSALMALRKSTMSLMVGSLVDASLDLTNSWCATPKPTMIKKRSPLPSAVQRMLPN